MNLVIRTLTGGFNPELNGDNNHFQKIINNFFSEAEQKFNDSKIDLRTKRINIPLFNDKILFNDKRLHSIINKVLNVCDNNDIRWICSSFNTFDQDLRVLNNEVLEIMKRHKNIFVNYIVAKDGKINKYGFKYASKMINLISNLSNTGYDNFRFGTSFNCVPNTPFFPFTYQEGDDGFSISLELVPVIIDVVKKNKLKDLKEKREEILKTLIPKIIIIDDICRQLESLTNIKYNGIDLALAPYPENDNNSVAALIESFGIDNFGSAGTLFTGFLTDIIKSIIKKSSIKSIGFNGVMYSILEDTKLGQKSSAREFSIDSLISYSTVCGCGIDMVPIPGDSFEEEISSLMLDVATISILLKKPLGFRILPIPMKKANEFTNFSHDFLVNSRIQSLKNRNCFSEHFDSKSPFYFLNKK